jgi:hypothetical protein
MFLIDYSLSMADSVSLERRGKVLIVHVGGFGGKALSIQVEECEKKRNILWGRDDDCFFT